MSDPIQEFEEQKKCRIEKLGSPKYQELGNQFVIDTLDSQYCYNFTWMGVPLIQFPQDMVAMQELIWSVKPDWIIETGIAHGGSLLFYQSVLELTGKGSVIGVDIDIREHNKARLFENPLSRKIKLIEGSSIDQDTFEQVKLNVQQEDVVMVLLDSNHTHDHVAKELELYGQLVSNGSYLVVFDTGIEYMPEGTFNNRPWGKGNNPKTALDDFLVRSHHFQVDKSINDKLLITAAPGGYLKKVI